MKAGIAAALLVRQVRNTADWLWTDQPAAVRPLTRVESNDGPAPLEALLTAHWATVATYVPTDVDARIRHHAWQAMGNAEELAAALDVLDTVTKLDVHAVSARVHTSEKYGPVSGHDGEWFSVRAGAALRAGQLGDAMLLERIAADVDAELEREESIWAETKGNARAMLSVATIIAHNLGDLSRVVDTWSPAHANSELGLRYRRLGHEDGARFDGAFVYAGDLNKKLMALENHRFLPLRGPKALRRERAFLLPFGPYFYEWGRLLGSTKLLDDAERAEILFALVRVHELRKEENGCLRAIAGMSAVCDIKKLSLLWPANDRQSLSRGGIANAVRLAEPAFLESFHAQITR